MDREVHGTVNSHAEFIALIRKALAMSRHARSGITPLLLEMAIRAENGSKKPR